MRISSKTHDLLDPYIVTGISAAIRAIANAITVDSIATVAGIPAFTGLPFAASVGRNYKKGRNCRNYA